MKVSLERQGKNVVQIAMELEPEKAIKAYEVACRQLSHRVNIPGFRKGKAPRKIIEKNLGVDYIKREALEHIVPEMLQQAISEENLDVITEPEINDCEFELGSPLKLTAKFEVRPEVKLGQYQGLSVSAAEAILPADAMDRALRNVAESKASLKEVGGRPIVMGDTVVMDFECYVDDKIVEGGVAEGLILEMKEGNFLEGFCEQLVGLTPGTDTEVKVQFPDNYRNKELAGKPARFKVSVKGIRERFIPAVDDELARSVGQESLEALKALIQARLDDEVRSENESRVQREVVNAVIANAEVDIPDTMIERERELLLRQLQRMVESNGQSWDEFQKAPEYERLAEAKGEEARQRVLTSLVLGAIVRAEKMTVSDEEMVPYLAELAARYEVSIDRVARDEEVRRQVMEEVLTQKVVQFLVSQADIKLVADEEPAAEAESSPETAGVASGEGAKTKSRKKKA